MDSIRRGMSSKSEAYKLYLRTLLRESAVNLPRAELQAAFEREYDPVMVEHLAAALVARTERGLEDDAFQVVAKRALEDRDPGLRAATVRAMRRTGALERSGEMFERLVRDPSPEVRRKRRPTSSRTPSTSTAGTMARRRTPRWRRPRPRTTRR